MQKLAEICIRRPVFATVLILLLTVVGAFGYTKLGVDRFPEVEFPMITVTTILPGAAPEDVETEITDRIEEAVNTVSGIEELRSTSQEGQSTVLIEFVLEKDADVAVQEVRDKVELIAFELPEEAEDPIVGKFDFTAAPVLSIAISADAPLVEITEYADKVLRRRLESSPGVGQVNVIGGQAREIRVTVNPEKLRSYGVTIADVERALRAENSQLPVGTLKRGPEEVTLRALGRVENVESLLDIPIVRRGAASITIRDIGAVEDTVAEQVDIAELNGRPTVVLEVIKQSKTNTVEVVDGVRERLAEEQDTLPEGYRTEIVRDDSVFIRAALHSVQEHLLLGSLFAALVVFIFLANWRTTLIAAIAIPTSIISTFAIMWFMGFTLNMITLLALTLSVGIVVDDAIVVLENIYRFIEEKGYSPFDAAVHATREIGLAVLAITLSLIAVFLPVGFMDGMVGKFMASFGVTMSAAIAVSMIVSFTLTPMLSARMLRGHKPGEDKKPKKSRLSPYRIFERIYMAMLAFSLRHRWIVVVMCVGVLGSIFVLIPMANKNFLPADDESQFSVAVRAPEGTSLETMRGLMSRISESVRSYAGITYTVTRVGSGGNSNFGSIYVRLDDVSTRDYTQYEMMDLVRTEVLGKYDDGSLRTSVAEADSDQGPGGRNADVMYVVSGPDLDQLAEYAEELEQEVAKAEGALDVDSSLVLGKPQYGLEINRAKAAELGVTVTDIARTLRLLVAGDEVSSYDEGGERYDIVLRADAQSRNNPESLKQMSIPSSRLGSVTLGEVVTFDESTGPAEIQRLNRRRQVTIFAGVDPAYSQQAVIDAADAASAKLGMDAGYSAELAGRSKELAKSANAFFIVFLMSLIFMYLIIAAQFESWLNPFIILLSLPLTLPFALIAVIVMQDSLNIFSMLGVLVLFAVVKKNSILQIDHTNQLRAQGMEITEAILQANRDRLRPILMTTIAFVAGMLPLAMSTGVGSATNRTISSVVIGGQTLSLLLTLIAVPVAYSLFDSVGQSWLWKKISSGFGKAFGNSESAPEVLSPLAAKSSPGDG